MRKSRRVACRVYSGADLILVIKPHFCTLLLSFEKQQVLLIFSDTVLVVSAQINLLTYYKSEYY